MSRRNSSERVRARPPWQRALVGLVLAAAALSLAAATDAAPRKGWRGGGAAMGYRGPGARGPGAGGMYRYGAGRFGPGGAGRTNFGATGTQPGASRFTGSPGAGRAVSARGMLGQRAALHRGPSQVPRATSRAAGNQGRRPLLPGERGFTGVPPAGERRFIQNEMVLHVGAEVSAETVQGVAARLGLTQIGYQRFDLVGRGLYRFRITDGRSVSDVIRAMEAEKITATAQPNYVFKLQQDLNAARRSTATQGYQYILAKWRLPDVHRVATGKGVLVAMIDSEVDQRHPDLAGAIADRLEPIGQEFKPQAHGTGMAGAMAAHRRLVGVAPGARILAVNAFGTDADSAYGTTEQILKGIDWAIAKGAKVINMSFAGPRDPLVQLALKKAYEKGIVLVAAAGNAGPNSEPLFPAADPDVIAVTATDVNDALLPQANRGAHISVAAPGVDILVPAPNAQYQLTSGTSVASAEVSGVIALMLERKPDADPASIRRALQTTAKDLGARGRDDDFGWGLVDPYLAMLALDNPALANARAPTPLPQQ
ncbi:MAG TPA: S8 family serine peptidase [Xanthobacteraceae bacterium]|nr:S8 family serine peptidase [Xanthobacteraceae bacterium]